MKLSFFCCMPRSAEVIQFGCLFGFWLLSEKITLKKIQLYDQNFDASESRAKFWIYVGNKKHSKLSARIYGFSCLFKMGHLLEKVGSK